MERNMLFLHLVVIVIEELARDEMMIFVLVLGMVHTLKDVCIRLQGGVKRSWSSTSKVSTLRKLNFLL